MRKSLFDNCLEMIPHCEWQKEVEFLEARLSAYKQKDRRLKRALYKSTAEVALDGNGRFLISKRLMDLVGVAGDVMLLGVGSKIEFWDKNIYESDEIEGDDLARNNFV